LVATYADLPVGTTDATMIALAKRLNVSEVATLDRRHFAVVRPRHVSALLRFSSRDRRCGTTPSECV
jgi:predicted nucleic acid-binding protein